MEIEASACASASAAAEPRGLGSNTVNPNYFAFMRVPIVKGRGFGSAGSPSDPPEVVVNETMARNWWPGEDAIGKLLWLGCKPSMRKIGQVIGIARDSKYGALNEDAAPFFYVLRRQDPGNGNFALIVRTAGNPYQWAKPLLRLAQTGGPNLRVYDAQSLDDVIGLSLREVKWQAALLGSLGLAIVLAAIGLYGVVAYAVSQRTREIGVRMALGARPGDVLWMVLARGLRITGLGVIAGLVLSAGTVRLMRAYLYGLSPFDPIAFLAARLAWVAIAMLASWYPARRATRVDPITALQYE